MNVELNPTQDTIVMKARVRRILCKELAVLGGALAAVYSAAGGTWVTLANPPPENIGVMLLLSDGTVMANNRNTSTNWFRLTPDIHGSYINGTWTTLASMHDTRGAFASQVLTDGKVFVAGGEVGTGIGTAEVYNYLNDTWVLCPPPGQLLGDALSEILPNGSVLVAPADAYADTIIYDPAANSWKVGPDTTNPRTWTQYEASWVKLPDNSILTVDNHGTNSERYIPSLNRWVNDATVPVALWDEFRPGSGVYEIGAAVLLPNGKAIFFGSSGHTALYIPSGTTNAGTWVAGPDIPDGQMVKDMPAAMMANGKVLCETSPIGTYYGNPVKYYEYDPAPNSFTPVGTNGLPANVEHMLDLPDGTVLCALGPTQIACVYQPSGSPLSAGKPTISSLTTNKDGTYHLTGTLFNGISAGAVFGDDAQMNSNYPLVRMTGADGNVYYAQTYNWSSNGVMTGNAPVTTEFRVSPKVLPGTYSLVVVANGIASDSILFNFSRDALQIAPLTGFVANGPVGGPFPFTSQSYALTNVGNSSINWSLANTSQWLNISPSSGMLAPGGAAATVTASLSATATNLDEGTFNTAVNFTNRDSGTVQSLDFTLHVQPVPLLVHNGGFEAGLDGWTSSVSASGNSPFPAQTPHSGAWAAFLVRNTSPAFLSQNVPTAAGQRYAFSFWVKSLPDFSADNEFSVSWNGSNVFHAVNQLFPDWTNVQFAVSATGTTTEIKFGIQNSPDTSILMDDVSVSSLTPPVFKRISRTGQGLAFTWKAVPGLTYQLQYETEVELRNWVNLGNPVTATSSKATASGVIGPDPHRFYRLLLLSP